jgi:TadE-like protein
MRSRARSDGTGRATSDSGQAAVELALALPIVLLATMGIVQVAVIARDQVAIVHAAREAARAAAVNVDATTAAQLAVGGLPLSDLEVRTSELGGNVLATASAVDHTDVPLIGWLLPDVTVSASASMMVEPPG